MGTIAGSPRALARRLGFDVVRHRPSDPPALPSDFDPQGHGARKAAHGCFEEQRVRLFLARTDYTGRLGTKE